MEIVCVFLRLEIVCGNYFWIFVCGNCFCIFRFRLLCVKIKLLRMEIACGNCVCVEITFGFLCVEIASVFLRV